MPHTHGVTEASTLFQINPITRVITNLSTVRLTLIQFDHNSERLGFRIPKQVIGHDMSKCNMVNVHYINIDNVTRQQHEDVYHVDDFRIDPEDGETVIFSWLISGNATRFVGALNFLVQLACVAEDGSIEYAWHTATYTGVNISDGMNNGEVVTEQYLDILAQWEARIKALEAGGVGGTGGGIPAGGKAGQVLCKRSDNDYDVTWANFAIPEQYGLVTYDQDKTITIT